MAKKKANKQINVIVAFVAAVLGVAAICMMFLPAIGIKDTDTTYTGMQVAFGYTEVTKVPVIGTEIKTTIFNFSFMNLLTYLLALVGVVFSVLAALGKGSKFANFVAAAAFGVAGVFFFLTVQYSIPNEDLQKIFSSLGGDIKANLTLAYGAIVGGVLSLVAALANLAKLVIK